MIIECPSCGAIKCYRHCNSCGKSIYWKKDEYWDKCKMYESGTEIEHHGCMKNGVTKFVAVKETNEYVLDEYRTIYRLGNTAEFKCSFCFRRGDLPVMLKHHNDPRFDCQDRLMAKMFKAKPTIIIDVDNMKLESWLE